MFSCCEKHKNGNRNNMIFIFSIFRDFDFEIIIKLKHPILNAKIKILKLSENKMNFKAK